jgi:hypothetical protein
MLLLVKATHELRLDRREVPRVRGRAKTNSVDQGHRLVDHGRGPLHTISNLRRSDGGHGVKTHTNTEQPLANEIKERKSFLFAFDDCLVRRQPFPLRAEIANGHSNHRRSQWMKVDVHGKQFARLVSTLEDQATVQRARSWRLVKVVVQPTMASAPFCFEEEFDFAADQIGRAVTEKIAERCGRKDDGTVTINDRRAVNNGIENRPAPDLREGIPSHSTSGRAWF